jgi:aspartate racemase
MKTIGLIGGMSWQSSLEYYRLINQAVKERLGGLHSARIVMYSVDFEEIEPLQRHAKWGEAAELMADAAGKLDKAGADFVVICTNTMHKVADEVQARITIPLLHIADATGEAIKAQGVTQAALLGTRFTMEQDFYKDRLVRRHGIHVTIPNEPDRQIIHDIIYDELCLGEAKQASRQQLKRIIRSLVADGAEGIILGCTELGLLIKQRDIEVPLFDTTAIHANAAVEFALGR